MIPREILKKIRQIEIRANRVATETLAGASFQPPAQFRWISRTVPDSYHFDFGVRFIDYEVNRVRPAKHSRLACFATSFGETKRLGSNRCNYRIHFKDEPNAKSFGLPLIPCHCFPKFKRGLGVMDDPKHHFRYLANVSSRSCSQEMPRPGFWRASSARRSSSAICSGVKSGSKPAAIRSSVSRRARSIRSSIGRAFAALNNSVALMGTNLTATNLFASA